MLSTQAAESAHTSRSERSWAARPASAFEYARLATPHDTQLDAIHNASETVVYAAEITEVCSDDIAHLLKGFHFLRRDVGNPLCGSPSQLIL
jgi:hypothetical protein